MVSYAEEGTAPELTRSVAGDVGPEETVSYYLKAAYGAGAPRYDMPQFTGFRWILPSIGARGRF